jgi:hypothetical protein
MRHTALVYRVGRRRRRHGWGVNRAKGRGRGSFQSERGTAIATWSAGKGESTYRIDMSTWRVVSQCFGNFAGTSLADALAILHFTRWRNVSTATVLGEGELPRGILKACEAFCV